MCQFYSLDGNMELKILGAQTFSQNQIPFVIAKNNLTFERFGLFAYLLKFNFDKLMKGPSGCESIDACGKETMQA